MDDDPTVARTAQRVLAGAGCEVELAPDGRTAEQLWARARQQRPFDLLILDHTVPGAMGGVETLARLRAYDPSLRALATSGYSNDPVLANHSDYGFVGTLPKPWSAEELRSAVEKALRLVAGRRN